MQTSVAGGSKTRVARTQRTMKAAVFLGPGRIVLQEKPIPAVGPTDALVRVTTTTICGTDVHILKGEYPVRPGLTIGHEPVGVIAELGAAVTGYQVGQRVIAGAITPCGQCHSCLGGDARAVRRAADGRLALRQHHRRVPGRVRPGPERAWRTSRRFPTSSPTSRCSCAPTS